jgi:hypothetical protein
MDITLDCLHGLDPRCFSERFSEKEGGRQVQLKRSQRDVSKPQLLKGAIWKAGKEFRQFLGEEQSLANNQ